MTCWNFNFNNTTVFTITVTTTQHGSKCVQFNSSTTTIAQQWWMELQVDRGLEGWAQDTSRYVLYISVCVWQLLYKCLFIIGYMYRWKWQGQTDTPPSHTNTQLTNRTQDAAASWVPSVFSFINKNIDNKWGMGLETCWCLEPLVWFFFFFFFLYIFYLY